MGLALCERFTAAWLPVEHLPNMHISHCQLCMRARQHKPLHTNEHKTAGLGNHMWCQQCATL
jgi:hypothetical protein